MNRTRISVLAAAPVLAAGLVVPTVANAAPAHAAPAKCGARDIAVTAGGSEGATGHGSFVLRFQNIGGVPCSIKGYPGLNAIGEHGHFEKRAKRTLNGFTGGSRRGIPKVTLEAGHFASADVEWVDIYKHGKSCPTSLSVNATPAGTKYTVHLARKVALCDLEVHPTVPGKSGDLPSR